MSSIPPSGRELYRRCTIGDGRMLELVGSRDPRAKREYLEHLARHAGFGLEDVVEPPDMMEQARRNPQTCIGRHTFFAKRLVAQLIIPGDIVIYIDLGLPTQYCPMDVYYEGVFREGAGDFALQEILWFVTQPLRMRYEAGCYSGQA